jgi:hypothetical protein
MGHIIKEGTFPPSGVDTVRAYKEVVPRIEKTAKEIAGLCNLNRTVHLPTYNRVITDEAARLRA